MEIATGLRLLLTSPVVMATGPSRDLVGLARGLLVCTGGWREKRPVSPVEVLLPGEEVAMASLPAPTT